MEDSKGNRNFWFFCAKPSICNVTEWQNGTIQLHTWYNELGNKRKIFPNFQKAQIGDLTIFYASSPIMSVLCIAKIVAIEYNKTLSFEKIKDINRVPYSVLKNCPDLSGMQFFQAPNGSFFKLTKQEFDKICEIAEV